MSDGIREDTLVYPLAVKLAGCLGNELVASGLGGQCFVGVKAGGTVALDDCGCGQKGCGGQAWVRVTPVFPSTDFPMPNFRADCHSKMAFGLEIGVAQCMPQVDSRGHLPSVDDELAAFRIQMANMQAMKRAIECCFAETDRDYVLGSYTPLENLGGCGGGVWTLTVEGF